ncbi:LSM11 [Branchiostoma lanceolatum]|uniref:LSM11 protein n=1 Tax=Branchiostoma lanceolatum TaxID=7740 RepID=A0A8K0EYJ2_BRALA|nr:LSM11 [Branchiostoma lanceolatum]
MEAEEEEAVDLTSPDFDPAKALSSQAVSLPVPNVRPFENLAQYESAMKGLRATRKVPASAQHGGAVSGKSGSKDPSTEAGPSARSLPPLVATHRKPAKTLLTRMKEGKQGPLEVLRSCINEKRRVIVATRTFKGLRGICTGYLVAFDKFWNLAMADVEEVYHKPPLGKKFFNEEPLTVSKRELAALDADESDEGVDTVQSSEDPSETLERTSSGGTGTKAKKTRRPRHKKQEAQFFKRHVNQLFVRGENVVIVSIKDA